MKKSRKRNLSVNRKKKSRTDLAAAGALAVRLSKEARQIAEDSQKLNRHAREMDRKADDVHHGIEDMHERIHEMRTDAASDEAEPSAIVIEEKRPDNGKPFTIVGVGASAGGYEAFVDFLKHLPASTGMGIVLVQHLDPKHKSKLSELLAHSTKVPVVEAVDGMAVEPDHIYVIPENRNMALSEGKLCLSQRKAQEMPPMPIDIFFRSLAQEQQNRAIAIVLSGTGSDGTLGIEAVKGGGGITFAQDEKSSKFFGMPGSAFGSGAVDFMMSPTQIASELGRIARHPYLGRPAQRQRKADESSELEKIIEEGSDGMNTLFRLLRSRAGVDFTYYKQSTLKRRILRRMVLHKVETLAAYMRVLQGKPQEVDALFNDLLINVTNFFRDPGTFAILKRRIFPKMLKAHTEDTPLRIWVCGCATGEEAYSMAMSLVEFFDDNKEHRQVQIFATDISENGIERARAGLYPENIAQDVSPERLRRFFTKVSGNYQIHKSIRDLCVFARQNVLQDPPFSNLDLVSCRNVLIYFGPILQRKIIPLFHYSLRAQGMLVLGGSETIGANADHFVLMDKKHKIYTKKHTTSRHDLELPTHAPEGRLRQSEPGHENNRPGASPKPVTLQQQVDRLILRDFSPGAVVVNGDMDVVQFRGRTADYLEHSAGAATLNLLKMAHDSLVMHLRLGLNKAARQNIPVKLADVEFKHNHKTRLIDIEVVPFDMPPDSERFYLVAFKETTSAPPLPDGRSVKGRATIAKVRQVQEASKLRNELQNTKESLQAIIEEQEATNEELKSANEEVQSSNEELQSTNEELETAKEELQSTNEELTTLNEELHNRNSELSTSNNDLNNLLASVQVAIIMVTNDLVLRRYTPVAERLLNLIPSDIGRPLSAFSRGQLLPELGILASEVLDSLTLLEREIRDRDGHWFLLRIRPYRTRDNKIDGVVAMLIDMDAHSKSMPSILGLISTPVMILGSDFKIRHVNKAFAETFNLDVDLAAGHSVFEISKSQWDKPEIHDLLEKQLRKQRTITGFEFEGDFPGLGLRALHINATRFAQDPAGNEMIALAIEDITGK
jgi:two-component system CheB/CheR fusion protein